MTLEDHMKTWTDVKVGDYVLVRRKNGDDLVHMLIAIDVSTSSNGTTKNVSFMCRCGNPDVGPAWEWDMAGGDEAPTCLACSI